MGEHKTNPNKGAEGKAKLMAAEIAADWGNEVVIIQEKSKEGIQLVQPLVFCIPMDAFILTACNLITQKIQKDKEKKIREAAGLGSKLHLPRGD